MTNHNINPCWWGSNVWQTIYFIVASYSDNPTQQQIDAACNFFKSLKYLLPCEGCQESYSKFSCESNTNTECLDNFKSKKKFIEFVFNLRNKVNSKLTHEYYIDLNYFEKKLNSIIDDKNVNVGRICNMVEAPFIPKGLEKKSIKYLKLNTSFDSVQASKTHIILKEFMKNPSFDYNNKKFKFVYERNKKCRKLIKKIYNNMNEGNYNIVESFMIHDKKLHESLLFLNCVILNKENFEYIIDSALNSKK